MNKRIALACTECSNRNYMTEKNTKNSTTRLQLNKYCKTCKRHTLHQETK